MVKIAIAGATSQLAREVIDKLSATGKHEIVALIRKDPAELPSLPGVQWKKTDYQSKAALVKLLEGVHTVLCFFAVHLDPENSSQKNVIDAAVEAGVKRYAPSEWSCGVKLESSLDVMPWYAGKTDIVHYLEELNKEKEVIEYCRFQPGFYMDSLIHPHQTSKHVNTFPTQYNYDTLRALVIEGTLDDDITLTTTTDIANIVARAVEYEGKWPVVGGISGDRRTIRELSKVAETTRGKPFTIDWLKKEDVEAGRLDKWLHIDLPSTPQDQIEAFSKMTTRGVLLACNRGVWTVSDEWNKLLPDYEFTKVEQLVKNAPWTD